MDPNVLGKLKRDLTRAVRLLLDQRLAGLVKPKELFSAVEVVTRHADEVHKALAARIDRKVDKEALDALLEAVKALQALHDRSAASNENLQQSILRLRAELDQVRLTLNTTGLQLTQILSRALPPMAEQFENPEDSQRVPPATVDPVAVRVLRGMTV